MLTDFHLSLIAHLKAQKAEFVLVGGHAALHYGSERTTGDMDLLVRPLAENGEKIIRAFHEMGLDTGDLSPRDFEQNLVLSFGLEPNGVDIINQLKGTDYPTISKNASSVDLANGLSISIIDIHDLLREKKLLQREGRKGLSDQMDILAIEERLRKMEGQ